jgi:tetratricopeptide (TPR) repeat protein
MLELYGESLRIARELGTRTGERIVLGNLGSVWQHLGEHSRAEGLFRQSLALARELGDRRGSAIALLSLGTLDRKLGRNDAAVTELSEAVSLLAPIRSNDYLAEAQLQLARSLAIAGDLDRATAVARDSLELACTIGRVDLAFAAELFEAEIALAAGRDPATVGRELMGLAVPDRQDALAGEWHYLRWRCTGAADERAAALAALSAAVAACKDPEIKARIAELKGDH